MDIEDIILSMEDISVEENDLVLYIKSLDIDKVVKNNLIHLIVNDNYKSYIDIYNICIENNIELPF